VVNNLLRTKFKIVTGYRTSEDVNLGLERGEVQARAFGFDSITSQHPDWITEQKVNFLVQSGARRDKRLPDVPLVTEFAKNDEQRQIFRLFSSAPALGQPYVAPPGLPADRLAVLRKAFSTTLSDKDFLADAEKIRFTIDAMRAEEVAEIVHQTTHAPGDIVAKAKAAISTPER
jgi:tripartite-type tricarboxylate transporter receptor subunit TctC